MDIAMILLLAAVILFVVAAFGVSSRISLTDLGLACFAAAFLVPMLG